MEASAHSEVLAKGDYCHSFGERHRLEVTSSFPPARSGPETEQLACPPSTRFGEVNAEPRTREVRQLGAFCRQCPKAADVCSCIPATFWRRIGRYANACAPARVLDEGMLVAKGGRWRVLVATFKMPLRSRLWCGPLVDRRFDRDTRPRRARLRTRNVYQIDDPDDDRELQARFGPCVPGLTSGAVPLTLSARLVVGALDELVHACGVPPEILLCLSTGLGGEEFLHQSHFLRYRGDTVGVGIVGAEDHPILAEHAVEIFQPVTQGRVVGYDLTVVRTRMIHLG